MGEEIARAISTVPMSPSDAVTSTELAESVPIPETFGAEVLMPAGPAFTVPSTSIELPALRLTLPPIGTSGGSMPVESIAPVLSTPPAFMFTQPPAVWIPNSAELMMSWVAESVSDPPPVEIPAPVAATLP